MSKPILHANASAKKWGGKPEEYLDIHDLLDWSKEAHADMRHRALFHNALGCFLVERIFGHQRTNSDGRTYSPRDVAEQHIIEDMGRIPSVSDYLNGMPLYDWLGGAAKKRYTLRVTAADGDIVRPTPAEAAVQPPVENLEEAIGKFGMTTLPNVEEALTFDHKGTRFQSVPKPKPGLSRRAGPSDFIDAGGKRWREMRANEEHDRKLAELHDADAARLDALIVETAKLRGDDEVDADRRKLKRERDDELLALERDDPIQYDIETEQDADDVNAD